MNYLAKRTKIEEVSPYLEAGEYMMDNQEARVAFQPTEKNHPIVAGMYDSNTIDRAQPIIIKDDSPKKFPGRILWFCSNGDIKIFSDKQVLILCSAKEHYQQKFQHYKTFSPFFQMPKLLSHDVEKYILTEELIEFRSKREQDDTLILSTIYRDYRNYFTNKQATVVFRSINELLTTSTNASHKPDFEDLLNRIDSRFLEMEFPFLPLHGDLWTDNLLLAKSDDQVWYIDWDTAGEYFFLFDFFKFMWNELDVHDNRSYYEHYLNGIFDDQFTGLFAIFNLEFQPAHKQDYLLLFFLNFMLDEGAVPYEVKLMELADFQCKILDYYGAAK
ncbi:phosphotransferase [Enterococcus sp. AZ109]|uniref:phosphotransferase n=1 Tax=Enterococcus sp. AZ109 TaxID=2774634 RepID=UPI003F232852